MTGHFPERREHRRYDVDLPCHVTIGHGQFSGQGKINGLITNISMGGAAIRFALYMEEPPKVGITINLYISGVGDFPSRVMRAYDHGFAVAFRPRKTWDKQLVEKLEAILPNDEESGAIAG